MAQGIPSRARLKKSRTSSTYKFRMFNFWALSVFLSFWISELKFHEIKYLMGKNEWVSKVELVLIWFIRKPKTISMCARGKALIIDIKLCDWAHVIGIGKYLLLWQKKMSLHNRFFGEWQNHKPEANDYISNLYELNWTQVNISLCVSWMDGGPREERWVDEVPKIVASEVYNSCIL